MKDIDRLASCACGCGNTLSPLDNRGRLRIFIHGHNGRGDGKSYERSLARKRAQAKRWYAANKLSVARRNATEASRARRRAREKRYRQLHPEVHRTNIKHRKALVKGANGNHSHLQWLARLAYYGFRCRYCGIEMSTAEATRDHQIPLSRGGSDWASNLVPACRACNSRKRESTITEFLSKERNRD